MTYIFSPKRYLSGLIMSIAYPWVCEDVPYGKMSRPWPMPEPQRARPAGPEHADFRSQPDPGQNFDTSPLLFWKSLIGRFYWEELKAMGKLLMKMAVFLQGHAFCAWTAMDPSGYFFFEKHSLIDFQIGKGRKRDFSRGRAAIFCTQRILRGRGPILSTQFLMKNRRGGRCDRKWQFSKMEKGFAGTQKME